MRLSHASGVLLASVLLLPASSRAQEGPLSLDELSRIFASGGDVAGWDEYQVPQFVAEYYGSRATPAILQLLELPTTRARFYLQLEALTAAGYAKLRVPVSVLVPYARGDRGRDLLPIQAEILQHRATLALTGHPEPALVSFWEEVARDSAPLMRQHAAPGFACALGSAAAIHIDRAAMDSDRVVRAVAQRVRTRFQEEGARARVCYGFERDSARVHPNRVTPPLLAAARRRLGEIPR